MSDSEGDISQDGEVVEFGWEEDNNNQPLGGRRKKARKEAIKKSRPGTFGKGLT